MNTRFFAKAGIVIGMFCGLVSSETSYEKAMKVDLLSFAEKASAMPKDAASRPMTEYTNEEYNFKYATPEGWIIDSTKECYDDRYSEKYLMLWVSNSAYSPRITLVVQKAKSTSNGELNSYRSQFRDMFVVYIVNILLGYTTAPLMFNISDSTGDTSIFHSVHFNKTKYANNNGISLRYGVSRGRYNIQMSYATTSLDYAINGSEYQKHFVAANFMSVGTIPFSKAGVSHGSSLAVHGSTIAVSLARQQEIKLQLLDMRGRKIEDIFEGSVTGLREFDVSSTTVGAQRAIVQLKCDKGIIAKPITVR